MVELRASMRSINGKWRRCVKDNSTIVVPVELAANVNWYGVVCLVWKCIDFNRFGWIVSSRVRAMRTGLLHYWAGSGNILVTVIDHRTGRSRGAGGRILAI